MTVTASAEDKKSSLNPADEKFVKQTGQSGMDEVKLATLGTQKAERTDVKDLATMLVADHTKVNEELSAFASSKGVELSAIVSADASDIFKALEKQSGKDFDKDFLDHMLKSHKKSVAAFEDMEKDAADADLKSWVSKTLPTLRTHLDKIKELKAK